MTISVPFQPCVRYFRRIHPSSKYQFGRSRLSRASVSPGRATPGVASRRFLRSVEGKPCEASPRPLLLRAMIDSVTVRAPARLHLGFLDMNGELGRRFGSLGLAIDAYETRITMRRAVETRVSGPAAARAR